MGDGFDLMKLIKEAGKMQEMVSSQQESLAKKFFEAETGGGMVKVKINGLQEIQSIEVEEEALATLGLKAVMDLVTAAVNSALQKAKDAVKGDMMSAFQNMAGGLVGKDE